jgi:hypothetical protein
VHTPPISAVTAQLNSVAPVDSNNIWAAGYSDNPSCLCGQTVIEHWNGSSWTRVKTPNPGIADYLCGIAAVSASDLWAVGYEWISQSTWVPLLLHYDGTSWKPFNQSQLQFGQLFSVFAVATNDVWAVGTIGAGGSSDGLALDWNGTSWTRVTFPTQPGGFVLLRSVSGVGHDDVWAGGVYEHYDINGNLTQSARSYRWDGARWNAVTVPLGGYSYLNSVRANATDDVWAVGAGIANVLTQTYSYVTFHWNGSKWSNVPNPNHGILNGVSASSSSDVWAVGSGFNTGGFSTGTYTIHYVVPYA